MSVTLPKLPERGLLADLCREAAARERLQPQLIEKDFCELFEKAAHGLWQLDYESEFGPQGIKLEVTIRPLWRPAREVVLRQLLVDPLAGDASGAKCFAQIIRARPEPTPRGRGGTRARFVGSPARRRAGI